MVFASSYPFLDVVWTLIIFFVWVLWFWLLIVIIGDIFRRHDLSGWGRVGWLLLILLVPFLGVFIYVIANNDGMNERNAERAKAAQQEADTYIKSVAGSGPASEIQTAQQLLDAGSISQAEFDTIKQRALAPQT